MSDASGVPADERQLAHRLLEIINSSWMSQATCVAVRLGIADLLANGPRSCSDLAAATGCNAHALGQFLNGLCSLDLCRQRGDGTFEISPMGRLLGTHSPYSVRAWATYWGESASPMWAHLYDALKTGIGARERLSGKPGFEHLQKDSRAAQIFNAAMVELTRLVAADAARAYDFSDKRVADIGGGYGELLAAVLEAHPSATGLLFDMEHAVAEAREQLTARGLASRCHFEAGDFFERIPPGADVYVLKSVIHDWNDERARTILKNCRRAMAPASRLLLLERLMPPRMQPTPEHQALARSDLHMLVVLGAHERAEGEFAELLRSAGFGDIRSLPAGAAYSFIEAAPASTS